MARVNDFVARAINALGDAEAAAAEAKALLVSGARKKAETRARESLGLFRKALDYSEDTREFDATHIAMDEMGFWVRANFGCRIELKESQYQRTCPVDLAHIRVGFSPAWIIESSFCSICGEDSESCQHISGRTYDRVECTKTEGRCNICGTGAECEHQVGKLYDSVPRFRIIASISEIRDVSFVSRPVEPQARLQAVGVPIQSLRHKFGKGWEPGSPLYCHRCVANCEGVVEFPDGPTAQTKVCYEMFEKLYWSP